MAATDGVATSTTLSAMAASRWSSMPWSVEAKTIRTLAGRRCKKVLAKSFLFHRQWPVGRPAAVASVGGAVWASGLPAPLR